MPRRRSMNIPRHAYLSIRFLFFWRESVFKQLAINIGEEDNQTK